MKIKYLTFTSLVLGLSLSSCVAKKKHQPVSQVKDATDPMYGKAAEVLNLLGAKVSDEAFIVQEDKRCAGSCHHHGSTAVKENYIKKWGESTVDLFRCLRASDEPILQEKCLRDPENPERYSTKALGFARAGVGTKYFQDLFKRRYTNEEEYKKNYLKFVTTIQMPEFQFNKSTNPDGDFNKVKLEPPYFGQDQHGEGDGFLPLNDENFQKVIDWALGEGDFQGKAMAYRSELMNVIVDPNEMPASCVENISDELVSHIENLDSFGWTYRHVMEKPIKFLGCETAPDISDAIEDDDFDVNMWGDKCMQKYPLAESNDYSKHWGRVKRSNGDHLAQDLRIVSTLPYRTTYWMRSSADGRFVGNGMAGGGTSTPPLGSQGFVMDLAEVDENGKERVIYVDGPYDPGFFPDNEGLTWMVRGGVFCNQKALFKENEELTEGRTDNKEFLRLSGSDPDSHCDEREDMGVYQHVGAQLHKNLSDANYYTVRGSSFANDDTGSGGDADPDPSSFADTDSILEIYKMNPRPSDTVENSKGFIIESPLKINTPYEGDYGISPSGNLITTRFAKYENEKAIQLGYRFSKVDYEKLTKGGNASKDNIPHRRVVGEICLKGGKASMSFNERFIVTHHVVENNDEDRVDLEYSADGVPAPNGLPENTYENFEKLAGNSSNIYMYDLLTKRQYRLTNMKEGQWATYPHFRADGWMYFLVRDKNTQKDYVVASDAAFAVTDLPR